MSDRVPPVDLHHGDKVTAMIGNTYCVRAVVGQGINWNWVAEPTLHFAKKIKNEMHLLPWRYLTDDDEGTYWIRGWSRESAAALRVAAALAG